MYTALRANCCVTTCRDESGMCRKASHRRMNCSRSESTVNQVLPRLQNGASGFSRMKRRTPRASFTPSASHVIGSLCVSIIYVGAVNIYFRVVRAHCCQCKLTRIAGYVLHFKRVQCVIGGLASGDLLLGPVLQLSRLVTNHPFVSKRLECGSRLFQIGLGF